ncbi:GntR family transcriptional regulator [Paenibacillus aurantius]|uniref:GntR family transcriptional regulator n=1 Tax=Paenibacillus aurantius TaxID=2918900 RepID=A0AA96LBE0_9BACL|nr:GntR family transcriptional regulator [Paenibacillus aurantius]WNQ10038.1 GntR family transcriptional regulator [Paenibacillus aurantius]
MNDKPLPKYLQLKGEILSWLAAGRMKPHERMPSENEISAMFGMSRQTVRQALGELEQEGKLYRKQGRGTFVSEPAAAGGRGAFTVGILTTYISDYIFPHIVRGAEASLRGRGYRLLLASTDNDKARERERLDEMMREPLSGLIIEPTKSAEGNPNLDRYLSLDYRNIPYLMINERYPEMTCPCLKSDDEGGGFAAASHLIGLGHTRIAGFFKTDDLQGVNRLKGFVRGHRENGLPLQPDLVAAYSTEEKNGKPFELALALLRREEERRPTAFVCYNDELAVHLLEAVRQTGLRVPEDLSIVGFDDSPLATATEVKLTTLAHPKYRLGEEAAAMLMAMIENGLPDGDTAGNAGIRLYPPELIIRESTRRIP